ncbi:hypothetical protein H8E65_08885 [Candidatus Bathyarchaeota archaeon]|nr:hypothetical protein [Candidatus Bathyarchaeota archaeon]MBL7079157.1 hypothetical protein [Candidatus Bathyarchaeota archaeon]
MTTAGTTVATTMQVSSYRVKFRREEFLRLVEIENPRRRMHFFAFDGFVMYTFDCDDIDFSQPVIEAIEFSNYQWSE